jgi:V8-like Glu-specific endopeptidase
MTDFLNNQGRFMKSLLLVSLLLISHSIFAMPQAPFDALTTKLKLVSNNTSAFDFEGIVKLSNCSGSLIRFSGQPDTAKAVVLTNGHCLTNSFGGGMPKPGEVIVNKAVARDMKIFNKEMKLFPIRSTRILFAAMTDTDMTLYELDQTYEQILKKYNVRSFDLDTVNPLVGTNIDVVSGYWERGYNCTVEGYAYQLKEDSWSFKNSLRYSLGCNVIGGTSGSPVVATGTRTVVAVNNTINESGKRCTMNNPCEVNENGNVTVMAHHGYAQETVNIYSCLRPDFIVDLAVPGCTLPKVKR